MYVVQCLVLINFCNSTRLIYCDHKHLTLIEMCLWPINLINQFNKCYQKDQIYNYNFDLFLCAEQHTYISYFI